MTKPAPLKGELLLWDWLPSRYTTCTFELGWLDTKLVLCAKNSSKFWHMSLMHIHKLVPEVKPSKEKVFDTSEGKTETRHILGRLSVYKTKLSLLPEYKIAMPLDWDDEFFTLLLWLSASAEKHAKSYKRELRKDWSSSISKKVQLSVLVKRIDNDFRNENKYINNDVRVGVTHNFKIQDKLSLDLLREGGFGNVYRLKNDEGVIVKQIKAETESLEEKEKKNINGERDVAQMARYEAKALALLHADGEHPNINKIRDAIHAKDGFWLFLQRCEQPSENWVEENISYKQKIVTEAIRSFVAGILSGFGKMHASGMVHLDQKAQNLYFHEGVVQIIDLGLVAGPGIDKGWRRRRDSTGTRGWFAPEEQALIGKVLSFRDLVLIDSYKVGLLLLRMLSRAFLPQDLWEKNFLGGYLMRWDKDKGQPVLSDEQDDDIKSLRAPIVLDSVALSSAVEAFGKEKSALWRICDALLPLIAVDPASRRDVQTTLSLLVKNGKLLSEKELADNNNFRDDERLWTPNSHDDGFEQLWSSEKEMDALDTKMLQFDYKFNQDDVKRYFELRQQLLSLGVHRSVIEKFHKSVVKSITNRYFDDGFSQKVKLDIEREKMSEEEKTAFDMYTILHSGFGVPQKELL